MTLWIKDNIFLTKLYFRQPGSGIFPDPDPGDPKRPDPTGSGFGSATLVILMQFLQNRNEGFMNTGFPRDEIV